MSEWQPTGAGEPVDELVIDDLELIGDLTHPLRGAIFRRLRTPHTAAELADEMEVPVTRLYHHLNRLEQLGVIRVVATRRVAAVTERRYQVTARSLKMSDDQFERYDPGELSQAMGALYDFAKLRLQREVESERIRGRMTEREALLALNEVRLSKPDQERLVARLREVVEEFIARDQPDASVVERFVVFIAAHPVGD